MTSIAWSTVALLVFLLPGFFFFVGLAAPEQFSRETALKNPLSQLAAVVSVSFTVHGLMYLASTWLQGVAGWGWPAPDLRIVLEAFHYAPGTVDTLRELADNVRKWSVQILFYVVLGAALGLGAGMLWGSTTVSFRSARRFAQHPWIYDVAIGPQGPSLLRRLAHALLTVLRVPKAVLVLIFNGRKQAWSYLSSAWPEIKGTERPFAFTFAFVLSNVDHAEKKLLYRGLLQTFGLTQEGRFAYLVLVNPSRFYMLMREGYPKTTPIREKIGETHTGARGARREMTQLVVEGSSVANVLFERWVFEAGSALVEQLYRVNEKLRHAEPQPPTPKRAAITAVSADGATAPEAGAESPAKESDVRTRPTLRTVRLASRINERARAGRHALSSELETKRRKGK